MGKFSSDNQPTNRKPRGKAKDNATKLIEAMERIRVKVPDPACPDAFPRKFLLVPWTVDLLMEQIAANAPKETGILITMLTTLFPRDRSVAPAVTFDFNDKDTPNERLDKVLSAVADGSISPDSAKIVSDMILSGGKLKEITEFEQRLAALEAAQQRIGSDEADV